MIIGVIGLAFAYVGVSIAIMADARKGEEVRDRLLLSLIAPD